MKSVLLLSLTILLAACSTTNTNTADTNETLTLEQIAEKSQSTNSILENDEWYIPSTVNNTSRNNTKDASNTKISTKETKKTTTTK